MLSGVDDFYTSDAITCAFGLKINEMFINNVFVPHGLLVKLKTIVFVSLCIAKINS